tara:strand:- start:4286 stop:4489 length:204 start_codon:yes stop_codon:yes gene_type:complete
MAAAAALAVMVVTWAVSEIAQIPMLTAVVASDTISTPTKAVVRISFKILIMMFRPDGATPGSLTSRE